MNTNRARMIAIGAGIPMLLSLIAGAAILSWTPQLPDPIAIHWSGTTPDGYGPVWGVIALVIGVPALYSIFVLALGARPQPSGRPSGNQKLLLATGSFLAGVFAVGIGGTVWAQRGLTDARQAGDVTLWVFSGIAVGIVLATIAWFLLPKADNAPNEGETAAPIAAAETQRAIWTRSVRIAPGIVVLIAVALAIAVATVIVTWIAAPQGLAVALVVLVTVVLLALATTAWRVTASARGLTVRSALGWPRATIAAADIEAVHVITVNPTAEFGGWGWRWAPGGRTGVIMRAGSAIEVTRRNGARFAVTVDDAETGAGVLAGAIARRSASTGR